MNKNIVNSIAERLIDRGFNKCNLYDDRFFDSILEILEKDYDLFNKIEDEIQEIEFSNRKISETEYRDLFGPFHGDE